LEDLQSSRLARLAQLRTTETGGDVVKLRLNCDSSLVQYGDVIPESLEGCFDATDAGL
jgi:hypothetical protein